MHIRSKFDGGKQINQSQKGSCQGRCAGAALKMNGGADWGPVYWEKVTCLPPSSTFTAVTKKACEILAKDRKRKSTVKEKVDVKGLIIPFSLDWTIHSTTMAQMQKMCLQMYHVRFSTT